VNQSETVPDRPNLDFYRGVKLKPSQKGPLLDYYRGVQLKPSRKREIIREKEEEERKNRNG
jgi:hypothetical protein